MLKKITLIIPLLLFIHAPAQSQSFHINVDFASIQPFLHFQLDLANHEYRRSYRRAYLKGYMDGVNDHYRYGHRYEAMVRSAHAYKAGYNDGFRDRGLLMRMRGRDWIRDHRFNDRDYYRPSYAIRLWLKGVGIAFSRTPRRRLPPGLRRKYHPRPGRHRGWTKRRRHHRDDDWEEYNEEREERYEEYYEEREERYEEYYEEFEEDD